MNIQAEKFTITMTHDELWNTAFDIKKSLEYTIKTHWVNHQESWKQNEAERLFRLRTMFSHLGRNDLWETVYSYAEETFKEFNTK